MKYPTIRNLENVSSIMQWKKGTNLIVGNSVLAGIEEKHISRKRGVKVQVFPGTTTHDMYDYLKPSLKRIQIRIFCIINSSSIPVIGSCILNISTKH